MGLGYSYKCSKCKKKYEVFMGIGMLYPQVYEETVTKVKNGKLGKEWKNLFEKTDNVAIDVEDHVYCCPECKAWKKEKGLSLYVPANKYALEDVKSGLPIFYGEDSIPAMMGEKPDYSLLKEYEHKCKKCGTKMHEASEEELMSLPCPKCGGEPDPGKIGLINWD